MRERDGGPAFPAGTHTFYEGAPGEYDETFYGMSLRDWFAGQALTGAMVAEGWTAKQVAERCYMVADAMLVVWAEGRQP